MVHLDVSRPEVNLQLDFTRDCRVSHYHALILYTVRIYGSIVC